MADSKNMDDGKAPAIGPWLTPSITAAVSLGLLVARRAAPTRVVLADPPGDLA